MPSAPEIFQLKISRLSVSPMIWRRVLVSSSTTLHELHGIVQVAMGWSSVHLFQFDIRAVAYGPWELSCASHDISLQAFEFRQNDRFAYTYDMGDYWQHEVRVENIELTYPKIKYPICTGGSGACPPEYCGGVAVFLARRDEADGYDAWCDMDVLTEFGKDLLDCHDTGRDLAELDLEDVRFALDRIKARERYTSEYFSRKLVNQAFRADRHRDLMHQQLI